MCLIMSIGNEYISTVLDYIPDSQKEVMMYWEYMGRIGSEFGIKNCIVFSSLIQFTIEKVYYNLKLIMPNRSIL